MIWGSKQSLTYQTWVNKKTELISGGSRKGQIKALRHGQSLEALLGMPRQRQQRAITALSLKSQGMESESPKPLRVGLLVMGPPTKADKTTLLSLLWCTVLEKVCPFWSLSFLHLPWASFHWSFLSLKPREERQQRSQEHNGWEPASQDTELGKAGIFDMVAL